MDRVTRDIKMGRITFDETLKVSLSIQQSEVFVLPVDVYPLLMTQECANTRTNTQTHIHTNMPNRHTRKEVHIYTSWSKKQVAYKTQRRRVQLVIIFPVPCAY